MQDLQVSTVISPLRWKLGLLINPGGAISAAMKENPPANGASRQVAHVRAMLSRPTYPYSGGRCITPQPRPTTAKPRPTFP